MEGRGLMGGGERAPATTVEKCRTVVPAEWHNGDATQTLSNPFIFHQTNSSESTLAFSAIQHLVNKIVLLYGTSKHIQGINGSRGKSPLLLRKN